MTDQYVYYVNGEYFTTDNEEEIPWTKISSPDENSPAFEDTLTGEKIWCEKGYRCHRLTGPASIRFDGKEYFYINDRCYFDIQTWLKDHPNPDLYFDAIGLNETERVLWFLQN
jgi:hypothetical protein